MTKASLGTRVGIAFGLVALLAAAVFFWSTFSKARNDKAVNNAFQKICLQTSEQLRLLTSAIDQYHQALGGYPPDHISNETPLVVDAVTNQLLYELLGSVHDSHKHYYEPIGFPTIDESLVKRFFNRSGFKNSGENAESVKHFLDITNVVATMALNNKPDVGVLAYMANWQGIDYTASIDISVSSWRYNVSLPKHNSKSYDLWIEISSPATNVVIGNW